MPVEILVYIFTLASTAYRSIFDIENQALWNGRRTLAVVVSVCRLWRSAALGAQSLWSTIVLPSGSKHVQQCLETSLLYSNKSVIDIFYFRLPGRRVYDNATHEAVEHDMILDILSRIDVSSRLRTISNIPVGSLALTSFRLRCKMGNLLHNAKQTIRSVGLLHWEHSTRSDSLPFPFSTTIDILECLPTNIRQLSIQAPELVNGIKTILARPTLETLWGRLSHLNITGPHNICLAGATYIFRTCVALEECQFSSVLGVLFEGDDVYGPMFDKERLVVPYLRQLVILEFHGDVTWLLDAISCPSIVNLAVKQNTLISREYDDYGAAMRWESFIEHSFSTSPSPKDILQEIWVHGLPTRTIEYLLSCHAAKSVQSFAVARSGCALAYPGCAELSPYHLPPVPSLDLHDVYTEAAEEYGLRLTDILKKYKTAPWYGWNISATPLRLGAFAIHCLERADICVDSVIHSDTPVHVDGPTIAGLD